MENVLERLKKKKLEIKEKRNKSIFLHIENNNSRTLYHTKVMTDFYTFAINKNQQHKFFIAFRGLFDREKINEFHLFSLRDNDRFLGIFYGYRKPIKNVIRKYEENGIMKASKFSKIYYIEFRFKKGSVFCYLIGIAYLLRKEKANKKYYNSLVETFLRLEEQVYDFYNKKLPDGGLINKWIRKNQK
ncbi:DUF226 domain-containing protein (plasmid) [Borrelia coriaceae]|uniref:Putative cytosolic protein n=1 Tax=Borrelia coriaceae ATCC 43381 TaxID=1408429 RepID=W5SW98_9SPIR|nr:DUF226 domain-containing protein [Borrelia coriaceae]AHH11464.1 Putative cytosolic protein [Borrelia coriaceae ATCC 43381]UPA17293.1 DUF226 domain-containing protein [Borrelia coriaceae]